MIGVIRWPALALACGLPLDKEGQLCIPSKSQQCKRRHAAGAPLHESLFVLTVLQAIRSRLIGARDLIIDSAPILVMSDDVILMPPTGTLPLIILVHYCEVSACIPSSVVAQDCLSFFSFLLPIHCLAPFARRLLAWAVRLYQIRPRVVRLDAAYWGLRLITWIHRVLGAVAVIPWNPKNQKNRSCLPPTWTKDELGKRSGIERFFGRVFLFFHLQRPPLCGWSEVNAEARSYLYCVYYRWFSCSTGWPS